MHRISAFIKQTVIWKMTIGFQLIWSSILAYSIIQGLLLFIIFPTFRHGSIQAKWLLSLLSLLSAIVLTESFIESILGYEKFPHLIFAFSPFWYALGPLLFFYIRLYVKDKNVRWIDFWHFIPMIIVFTDTLNFYQLPPEVKLNYFENIKNGEIHPIHNLNYIIFSIQCMSYLGVCWSMLQLKREEKPVKGELRWLFQLIFTLGVISLQSIFTVLVFNNPVLGGWTSNLYYISLTLFLVMLFVRSIKSPKTLYLIGRPLTFNTSALDTLKDFQQISKHLQANKPYLDPEYDIQNLASKLGYSKHHIMKLIKIHTQLSFRDYVNQFRIEEAKKRLGSPLSKQFTIEHIANESGFASQATFYRVFKKIEGRTPKSFIIS